MGSRVVILALTGLRALTVNGFALKGTSDFALAMTADYWLMHDQISGMLDWYLGLGAYGAVSFGLPGWHALGVRMPIALQLWPLDSMGSGHQRGVRSQELPGPTRPRLPDLALRPVA